MFGKAKGSSRKKNDPLPPAPQLQDLGSVLRHYQDLTPANLVESDSADISYIGPGVTVVGKISEGAQVEGVIAAQELTISGRFKGTIQANRVTLTSSAVVEGEIHHRFLAIEENAWFAGMSRPRETSASKVMDAQSPIQLVPTEENRQIDGSLVKEAHADSATG
jgi:cytoskeletal protein CcmA (bactofilin family)